MSADVFVPCKDTQLNGDSSKGPLQNAYIYGGGISGGGVGADVGIQLNYPQGLIKVGSPSSIQAFISSPSSVGDPVGGGKLTCDRSYRLTTYVTERGDTPNLVDAIQSDSGGPPIVLMQQVLQNVGWSKVCPRCRTKRVTSLAVKAGATQTVVGTWFGLQQPYTNSPTPTVVWRDALQSQFASASATRPQPPTHWFESQGLPPGGDTPANGAALGLIVAFPQDLADESVGINETGPRLILH